MTDEHKFRRIVMLILLGGTSFWGPVTLVELLTAEELNLALATFGPPTTLLLCYFNLKRKHPHSVKPISLWLLLGVYLLGPFLMFIAASAHGGGFTQLHGWTDVKWLLLMMVVPWFTIVLSGYQGTFFGLLGTTLAMFILRFTSERKPIEEKAA